MTTNIVCDGCNAVLDDKGMSDVKVKVFDRTGRVLYEYGPFDMCVSCQELVKHNNDIAKWGKPPAPIVPPAA